MAPPSAYDERLLLTRLKEGDELAFEQVYQLYAKKILGNIVKLVKSESTAAELLQEVFVKLWFSREKIDVDRPLSPYLFRIAQNQVYDFFRKAARKLQVIIDLSANNKDGYVHIEEDLFQAEAVRHLQEFISNLPPKRRTIFKMIKLDGLSYAEVSLHLNISESTINDHIVKATRHIQQQMNLLYPGAISVAIILHFS
ncbi:hypothetical protein A3860_21210 [Niastella vici]|uniref:RNA polymerase sigma-70 factor n=1 Tax=Niastella vici TaxID=1703345 RepID=A0A1V9G0C9_9BACT|nr:RNA polymerase sigma factor [Niastella vici]OQP63946.1 hypothetical protein A3860_21210 [Niastella vici]